MALPMMGYLGGTIEVRLDNPDGELLGQVNIESENPNFGGKCGQCAHRMPEVLKRNSQAGATRCSQKSRWLVKKPAAGFGNPFARPGIKTDIKPVNGLHDIYFVFKNENAKGDQPLMSVSNIKFNNEKQP